MVKYKKTILCLIILFLSMASVSASDLDQTDDTDVSNGDILSISEVYPLDNEIISLSENSEEILGDTPANFTELKDIIEGTSGSTVILYKDYTRLSTTSDDEKITINKELTIDGQGYTLNGNELTIFNVSTDSRIVFKNITFTNAKGSAVIFTDDAQCEVINCTFVDNLPGSTNGYAGAITFKKKVSNSNITDCIFNNNKAPYAAAIYAPQSNDILFKNVNFTNNRATSYGDGGAINMYSANMTNCNFINNTAENNGGAVYFSNGGTVTNCNFSTNNATRGGAVYFNSIGTVTNCNFSSNEADYGGAVYFYNSGSVENCNFSSNEADYGGAVYFISNGNVTNCNFTDNQASGDGGAIRMGSGSVINCNFTTNNANNGGAVYFSSSGGVINCNFTDNKAVGYNSGGGAVYFSSSGSVENCSFTASTANNGGAVYFSSSGSVENCNFTDNKAVGYNNWGGAVYFDSFGDVINCNFSNNEADNGGAIFFDYSSNPSVVTNCNFSANNANNGGAVYFWSNGDVTNCNFTDNTATTGSAIYFYSTSAQKSVSNSIFLNNRANAKDLQVTKNENNITIIFTGNNNILNAIYSRNDAEVSFSNVTYWGANGIVNTDTYNPSISNNAAGQNITIKGVVNGNIINTTKVTDKNGKIVLDAGDYLIIVSHKGDSYYTEVAERLFTNMTFNVNVTNQTSNNRTVNITAKSNIPNEVLKGKLLFILPNSTQINANYTSNGTWWAVHEFDDAGDYIINASYIGLDGVIINNATISIRYDARVDVNNKTLDLLIGDEFTIVANTTPEGLNVTFVQDDSGVYIVSKNGVVTALKNGTGSVLVQIGGDGVYAKNSTIVNVTVSKVPTEITVLNDTLDLKVDGEVETGATLTPADAGNLIYTVSNPSIVKVENGKVIALKKGNSTITVSFAGDKKYLAAENKTINVTVSLNDVSVKVNNDTLDLLVDDKFNLIATTEPKDLTVNYTSSNPSIVTVDNKGNVVAVSEGNAIITVSVGGDGVYAENSTDVRVSVSKVPTEIKINSPTGEMPVGAMGHVSAELIPSEAGKLSYVSNDTSIATVSSTGVIKANKEGTALITVSFAGNDKYAASENKTIKLTVKKVNTLMDVSADDITEGENATISVTLPSDATGNVNTTVNGKTYSSEVKDGKTTIIIPDLIKGDYTLPVSYSGDDKYNPSTEDVNFTVKEDKIIVSAPDLTKYYSGPEPFIVNVTYANGRAIADKEVKITINGVTYTRTTDENGIASLSINLNSKTYDVTTMVDNITVNSLVTILPTIEAEDVESKSKNIVFDATFLDSEGNYLTDGTNVSFNIGGVIYNAQVSGDKGLASVDLILDSGRYLITSQNTVTSENAVNSIAVDLKDADMVLSGDEISVGENATISVTLPSDAAGNVTSKINGKTYISQVKDGKATITIPDLSAGNYTVQVTYSGDYNYNSAVGEANITVNKVNATMTVDAAAITVGENATVTVTLPEDATGYVTIGDEIVPVKEGAASAVLTDLPVGTNTVPVTYLGDDKYNSIEMSADIVVNEKPVPAKENLTIKATAGEIIEGDDAFIIVNGLENATGNVSANINGKTYTAPISEGKATITVPGLTENATAVINYPGDDKYNPATTSVNITVNKNTVTINAQNLTKYYKDPQKFTVTVSDAKGRAAANKTVEININGVTYTRTTDENGIASLNINLNSGVYPVTVAVDDVVVNSSVFIKSTIDASDVVKVFRNDTQYYATFVDVNGTPVANKAVSFNVNGVFYNRTTDENGTAKLNINLPPGEYILTATNTVTGEKKSNVINVLSFIESGDLTKYFKNESQFVVRIHAADGSYVGAGQEVKFNINGIIYTRTTNATGHAKININLGQGNYAVTTYYKDYSQRNNIEVLPILSAGDLVMKYMDGSQFKARLVDGKGNPYPNQDVTFNINGVLYNRPTDDNGVARLNIRLPSGEYIITSSYNGCNIANKVTIRG